MKRLLSFLRAQIADLGLLGFLFMCILLLVLSPIFILCFIGYLLECFNEKTMEWFGGKCE